MLYRLSITELENNRWMNFRAVSLLLFFSLFIVFQAVAQVDVQQKVVSIEWYETQKPVTIPTGEQLFRPAFKGAVFSESHALLPLFVYQFSTSTAEGDPSISLENMIFQEISTFSIDDEDALNQLSGEVQMEVTSLHEKSSDVVRVELLPIRINEITGRPEMLVYADLSVDFSEPTEASIASPKAVSAWASESVLASGEWYKIAVNLDGVYKITAAELASLGISTSNLDPRNIRIYGNGGGMLPEITDDFRHDDLVENAIYVYGEEDGSFDDGDYILFYGQGTLEWVYDGEDAVYNHVQDIYSGDNYYFITVDKGAGKRVQTAEAITGTVNYTSTSFDDYYVHELEEKNLAETGRAWYGETFNVQTEYIYTMEFDGLQIADEVNLKTYVAARSSSSSRFLTYIDDEHTQTLSVSRLTDMSPGVKYANLSNSSTNFYAPSENFTFTIEYDKLGNSGAIGWLNYFTFNFRRALKMHQSQVKFRDHQASASTGVAEFVLGDASNQTTVWEISDPLNPTRVSASLSGVQLSFLAERESAHEYIAFNQSYYTPAFIGPVANQNLHGLSGLDMVILSYSEFLDYSETVAEFHRNQDDMNVFVVTPEVVFNEFSSGKKDISAIRDFLRMLYKRAPEGQEPKHILLYGDASYDYRSYLGEKTDFVSTWEHPQSMNPIGSIATDDYFVMLDDGEGYVMDDVRLSGLVDMGIGRFPVYDDETAALALNKMMTYVDNNQSTMNTWRNRVCFVADDEDSNQHVIDSDDLSSLVEEINSDVLIKKIYLDAYQQESTPGGQRYPEAKNAIITAVDDGVLVLNYMGHGGENGFAHERVLEIADIQAWTNINNMPFFVTATCEFSRFDDPEKLMAGEYLFLNPDGGAIGLFTTTRSTYASSNNQLSENFYNHLFRRVDGEYLPIGEVIKEAKRDNGESANSQKYVLLGNPAMRLAYPQERVITAKINDVTIEGVSDTLSALSLVTISGYIDEKSKMLTSFNGEIFSQVFDKESQLTTLGQDAGSSPYAFTQWQSLLYKGRAEVKSGEFEFSFVVPRDIAYNYGPGRILYYARDLDQGIDANGSFGDIIVGGISDDPPEDLGVPDVKLYMNDTTFVNGGMTDENPLLWVEVSTGNGINITGSAIGHDMLAVLDGDNANAFILNNFYNTRPDTYKKGDALYPLYALTSGAHTIEVTVWDIYNNSQKATLDFVVNPSGTLVIENLQSYPNPMTDQTTFVFDHNQSEEVMSASIHVFDMAGRCVRILDASVSSPGYTNHSIQWDGRDAYGSRLAKGVYIYTLDLTLSNGLHTRKTSKLIILTN